ncbi:lanthionine synthetase C family protein [Kribbella sp. NPDC056861]|uniref:lanthionine synthetase C family protein n=1 Tax=Kribbella sp. NPDC056861 TaxID=3154857 RepID=UPI00343891E2
MTHETATPSPGADTRAKPGAQAVVDTLADRLRDPEAVVAATTANGDLIDIADIPCPPWDPSTLSRGPGALAILYSELGDRETAHEYLLRTVAASGSSPVDGPFQGLGGLATATRLAARDPDDYAGILGRLDDRMSEHARWLVRVHEATRQGGVPTCAGVVDTISGLSGVGRYLLARGRFDVLREVLSCLATLREPIVVDGVPVPGWWFDGTEKSLVGPEFEQGQVNFGLAHGIPGPLALLSLAWTAGVRVEGQAEAIECIADWLLEWREKDAWGSYWTAYIPLPYYADRTAAEPPRPARASWCYGAPAIARTLEFAATALDRPEWSEAGLEAFRSLLTRPRESWGITDDALCHGWAGMLNLCTIFDRNHPDENFGAVADEIATGLAERFDPALPFGYRYHQPLAELSLDLPGLMEGAAGIALALDGYVRAPRTGWDSALLLS